MSGSSMVYVYKSLKSPRRWLYLAVKDAFAVVPGGLLDAFGAPSFVMAFDLNRHARLPKITPEQLRQALSDKGYLSHRVPFG